MILDIGADGFDPPSDGRGLRGGGLTALQPTAAGAIVRRSRLNGMAVDRRIVKTGNHAIGFASEEDWFEYRLAHHPEFLRRIEEARAALRAGR